MADPLTTMAVTVSDGLARVEFTRPERGNEVDSQWIRELTETFTDFAGDASVRAVVVSAREGDFCAGMGAAAARDELGLAWFSDWEQAMRTVEEIPVPVVCAVSGRCMGAGLQLASVCDVRIATADAIFVATAPSARLVPGMSWWRLPRYLGTGRAKYLIMVSSGMTAAEALRIGMADEVVDDAVARSEEIARGLFAFAPTAFAETKRLINKAPTMQHDQAVAEFLVAELRCLASANPAAPEGAAAAIAAAQREAMRRIETPDPTQTPPAATFDPRW